MPSSCGHSARWHLKKKMFLSFFIFFSFFVFFPVFCFPLFFCSSSFFFPFFSFFFFYSFFYFFIFFIFLNFFIFHCALFFAIRVACWGHRTWRGSKTSLPNFGSPPATLLQLNRHKNTLAYCPWSLGLRADTSSSLDTAPPARSLPESTRAIQAAAPHLANASHVSPKSLAAQPLTMALTASWSRKKEDILVKHLIPPGLCRHHDTWKTGSMTPTSSRNCTLELWTFSERSRGLSLKGRRRPQS